MPTHAPERKILLTHVTPKDDEPDKRPLDMRLILRMVGYMRRHRALRNKLFVFAGIRAVLVPLMGLVFGKIIEGPITQGDYAATLRWTGAFVVLALLTNLGMRYRMLYAMRIGEAVVHDLRNDIFAHLQKLSMSYFDRTKVGRLISRVTSDVENVRRGVQEVLFVSVVGGGWMVFAAVFMAVIDPALFLLVLGIVPIVVFTNFGFRASLSRAYRNVQESFSRLTATIAESVQGMRVTQGFVRQRRNAEIFDVLVDEHSQNNLYAARVNGLFTGLLQFNRPFFLALLLLFGGWRVLGAGADPAAAGGFTGTRIGDLIMFFFLADMFFDPITTLAKQYDAALSAMAGAERVFKLLDTPPAWEEPAEAPAAELAPETSRDREGATAAGFRERPIASGSLPDGRGSLGSRPPAGAPITGHVEFRHVHFGYMPDVPVLHDISFSVRPGQTLALVGQTGSGKSSVINLVAKFYLPTQGELLIDGRDIRDIHASVLHRHMGIVQQKNFLFTGTVMDNIRLGRPAANDAEVVDAARRLDCLDLLDGLPEGPATQVGERGGHLSAGQQQLVCFCRAMLADPRILILDEATSAIDPLTEARIQKALQLLVLGRTSFVVAHRLSTIRHADQVLVLDQGRIVEEGTHPQLLELGGVYADLYRQFAGGAR